MSNSLLDQAHRQVATDAERCHALLDAAAPDIRKLEQLCTVLAARGWKAMPSVACDAATGVALTVQVEVHGQHRGELLEHLIGLDIAAGRIELDATDVTHYILTLAGSLRIGLQITSARVAA